MEMRRPLGIVIGLAAVLALAAGMVPDVRAQARDDLIAGAKREGELVSYGMPDGWVGFEKVFKLIETRYGVQHTADGTAAATIPRLLAERDAPVMDIAQAGYDILGRVLDNNLAMPYKNGSWEKIPDGFKDQDGRWVAAYWGAVGFLVDAGRLQTVPETWSDLLKAEYKNKICGRDPRASTFAAATVLAAAYANGGGESNVQPGLDWFRRARESGNLRRSVRDVTGFRRNPCLISFVYDFDGFALRDNTGRPFRVVIPKDGTVGVPFAHFISAVAPHPNAAKLALDVLLSDEGQALLADGYAHPVRKVPLPPDLAAKMSPESASGKIFFPTSPSVFSAAMKKIRDGLIGGKID